MKTRQWTCVVTVLLAGLSIAQAHVIEFPQDFGAFSSAAGNPGIDVSFDDVAGGSNLGGQSFGNATLTAPGSPLIVVDASSTASTGAFVQKIGATNRLFAQSGANVLSPGGATLGPGQDDAVENDDLRIDFASPIGYFGVEHLSQRCDGFSFTRVQVLGAGDQQLLDTIIPISILPFGEDGVIPGGADFWGIISDENDIHAILFNEVDADNSAPDNNIGYDSLRFGRVEASPPVAIPLPAAILTTPALLALAAIARRRFSRDSNHGL